MSNSYLSRDVMDGWGGVHDLVGGPPTRSLVHASDAVQGEAILILWGPDGLGKPGSEHPSSQILFPFFYHPNLLLLDVGHTH